LTGTTDPGLLRASHIKPWSVCETNAERLDVHNGLLLSALWDAAFDQGLVTFTDDGVPVLADDLTAETRTGLSAAGKVLGGLTDLHRGQLSWHRTHLFQKAGQAL
jgi:predicted restriction endonuclease